ncbi:MAG: antitoxin of toxin-antitoxin stability system [Alphaproteobacteria bacterium]|nr:antitoxin of toxin-antitoxin stability system [Alphaproteobacteria bacterium]
MPRIIETTVYTIDELSDAAREHARAWYRESCLDYEWYDFVYEDFGTICRILGVTLRTSPMRLYGGGTRDKPHLNFSGFWSQGDGACFAGRYCYARGAAKAIRVHAPQDTELHRIADELQTAQRRNFFQLHGTIRQTGRYCHEYTMAIEVERDSPTWQPVTDGAEDTVIEVMRDLARWLYRQLRQEYEHLTSDDAIDETVADNGWTFTVRGERFG